jgi:hypothetical protein
LQTATNDRASFTFDRRFAANGCGARTLNTETGAPRRRRTLEDVRMPTTTRRPALLPLAALLAVLSIGVATEAAAREAEVTGPKGKTVTRQVEREKGQVQTSVTGEKGHTRARTLERSKEAASATVTRRDGSTVERETTRTEGGSTSTLAGSKGGSATAETTRTETGSTTTVTGANGKTATVEHERGSLRDKVKARRENKQ